MDIVAQHHYKPLYKILHNSLTDRTFYLLVEKVGRKSPLPISLSVLTAGSRVASSLGLQRLRNSVLTSRPDGHKSHRTRFRRLLADQMGVQLPLLRWL
jgi:hypothetical protein